MVVTLTIVSRSALDSDFRYERRRRLESIKYQQVQIFRFRRLDTWGLIGEKPKQNAQMYSFLIERLSKQQAVKVGKYG